MVQRETTPTGRSHRAVFSLPSISVGYVNIVTEQSMVYYLELHLTERETRLYRPNSLCLSPQMGS